MFRGTQDEVRTSKNMISTCREVDEVEAEHMSSFCFFLSKPDLRSRAVATSGYAGWALSDAWSAQAVRPEAEARAALTKPQSGPCCQEEPKVAF